MNKDFIYLIDQNRGIICSLINKYFNDVHLKQDMEQNIIVEAYESYPNFKWECKFSTWLHTIAKNVIVSFLRSTRYTLNKRITSVCFNNVFFEITEKDSKAERIQKFETKLLEFCISRLNSFEQRLVHLYLKDLSYRQMSELTGLNENNLRVIMNRAKEKMRKSKDIFISKQCPFLIQ